MSYPFKMKDSSEKDEFDPVVSFLFSSDKDKKKHKRKTRSLKRRNK